MLFLFLILHPYMDMTPTSEINDYDCGPFLLENEKWPAFSFMLRASSQICSLLARNSSVFVGQSSVIE